MNKDLRMKTAFTLAEVLITLGIIGIVSAMTIPTLINNYQKKVTVAKLQKVHAVLNQIARSAIANDLIKGFTAGQEVTAEKTEEFFNEFIFSQLKSPKVISKGSDIYTSCESNLTDYCYRRLNGTYHDESIRTLFDNGRAFFIVNDENLYYIYNYRWDIKYDEEGNVVERTLRYITNSKAYVDINGSSGPNILGKDIFIFTIDFDKGSAYPMGYTSEINTINSICSKSGTGLYCAEKIRRDGWQIKDDYPW